MPSESFDFHRQLLEEMLSIVVEIWAWAAKHFFTVTDAPITTITFFGSGAYFIMMAFYIQIIWKRGLARNRLLASVTISLFIMCTAHCIFILAVAAIEGSPGLWVGGHSSDRARARLAFLSADLLVAANIVYVTASGGAGYSTSVLFVLEDGPNTVLSNTSGPVFLFFVTIGVSLLTTFILMALTVGRIWMLARTAQKVLGAELTGTYHTVCAMILESGSLYLCGGIVYIFAGLKLTGFTPGIAPTIIAVRVALGQSVDDVNSFIVPRPREACATALDQRDDEVLYIGRESVKVEAV
ncbi:hypothetical protein GGX14DRAFT_601067 [Mycena pura]|uniref:Uncharacterized protein n=1 Tax=Mycena pura TaxID=153505 RepID=A0AAD6UN20_9AGAR|nr:hypothetical protein GGX14DRAFT_601067 [Mycena pura]